ncbi:unnamed protein product [Ambrosiozyma monospora]|uniref:Unnamed protein product n=1 Tax=Ambrosiozyma monospora TaxID=43982 RepID=A0ACB5TAR9_AMBMO|nr:unnamed protein product [Ambrosiozyma monospora]
MAPSSSASYQSTQDSKSLDIKDKYQQNEKHINEEFKIWKKTSPMLYDLLYTYSTSWPSLTLQWTRDLKFTEDKKSVIANLLMGTHTTKNVPNKLRLYSVTLPATLSPEVTSPVEVPNFEGHGNQFELAREWEHPGEINKARINHENGLIATQTNTGDVLIFDSNDEKSKTHRKTLKFHNKEGFDCLVGS